MSTRATLRSELANRLGDPAHSVWSSAEKNGYLDFAIKGLYPYFYMKRVATTTADVGPVQFAPSGARNIYKVALLRTGSTRLRPMRGWVEGDGQALVPKTGITNETLVWAWTVGWEAPADDTETLTILPESEEVVLLRAQISALEKLLVDRVSAEKYFAIQVRQAVSEDDLANTLDALHASLRDRLSNVVPLPEVMT